MSPTDSEPRPLSASPTGVSSACILEWNIMASRLNEVLRFLRAERPAVNVESLVLGLQIELSQAALISGRLAIAGENVQSQEMYDHALALRHTVDRGLRVVEDFMSTGLNMPRWGSNSGTPAPAFEDLERDRYTTTDDWRDLTGAAQLQTDGNKWWNKKGVRLGLGDYGVVKSSDAARFWFRVMRLRAGHTRYVPPPEVARELNHALVWLTDAQASFESMIIFIERLMADRRGRLLQEYLREHRNASLSAEDQALVDSLVEVGAERDAPGINVNQALL